MGPIVETALERSRTSVVYQTQLEDAYAKLRVWMSYRSFNDDVWLRIADCDDMISQYVNVLSTSGTKPYLGKMVILAVQRFHPSVGTLTRSWRCLRSWLQKQHFSNRTPLPIELLPFLFANCLDQSVLHPNDCGNWIILGILCRVGFYCLLRPAEICRLCAKHCKKVYDATAQGFITVISIERPKNKAFFGRAQFAVLKDSATQEWLWWLLSDLHPEQKLWIGTSTKFRKFFKRLLRHCKLDYLGLLPSSLRTGGTTHFFLADYSTLSLQMLGRWKSHESLLIYIQECVALLVMERLHVFDAQRLAQVNSATVHMFARPPQLKWQALFSRCKQYGWKGSQPCPAVR